MLIADIKVLEHRLIYVDVVQACLDDTNLIFKPINNAKLAEAAIKGARQDTVWV